MDRTPDYVAVIPLVPVAASARAATMIEAVEGAKREANRIADGFGGFTDHARLSCTVFDNRGGGGVIVDLSRAYSEPSGEPLPVAARFEVEPRVPGRRGVRVLPVETVRPDPTRRPTISLPS